MPRFKVIQSPLSSPAANSHPSKQAELKLPSAQKVQGATSDLAMFLVRSQLVSGGLTRFDD